jgi:hypothetical protein
MRAALRCSTPVWCVSSLVLIVLCVQLLRLSRVAAGDAAQFWKYAYLAFFVNPYAREVAAWLLLLLLLISVPWLAWRTAGKMASGWMMGMLPVALCFQFGLFVWSVLFDVFSFGCGFALGLVTRVSLLAVSKVLIECSAVAFLLILIQRRWRVNLSALACVFGVTAVNLFLITLLLLVIAAEGTHYGLFAL